MHEVTDKTAAGRDRQSSGVAGWARRHPVAGYFLLTFGISWTSALVVAAPLLVRGLAIPKLTGLMMFPAMLLGPVLAAVAMTAMVEGRTGLGALRRRIFWTGFAPGWSLAILIPPLSIWAALWFFTRFVSPVYAPNRFFVGAGFGLLAGVVEEMGWTGYALPAMLKRWSPFRSSVMLGLLWSLWHAPEVDFLGAATPHRGYWLMYFAAFAGVMTAMRVLIGWLYVHTGSVGLAQLMHAASTGSLVALSPSHVGPGQEAYWYCGYAAVLWLVVALVWYGEGVWARTRQIVAAMSRKQEK